MYAHHGRCLATIGLPVSGAGRVHLHVEEAAGYRALGYRDFEKLGRTGQLEADEGADGGIGGHTKPQPRADCLRLGILIVDRPSGILITDDRHGKPLFHTVGAVQREAQTCE